MENNINQWTSYLWLMLAALMCSFSVAVLRLQDMENWVSRLLKRCTVAVGLCDYLSSNM